jgi:hypothetical protein
MRKVQASDNLFTELSRHRKFLESLGILFFQKSYNPRWNPSAGPGKSSVNNRLGQNLNELDWLTISYVISKGLLRVQTTFWHYSFLIHQ